MARQRGINPISGTIDGYNYYEHKYCGHLVRGIPGPSAKDVLYGEEFENTRRHLTEYGRAAIMGNLSGRLLAVFISLA